MKIYRSLRFFLPGLFAVLLLTGNVFAAELNLSGIDKADTAWLMACAALVLFMTPGLALFYGGMVRRKNVLGTLMQCFFIMALVSIQWIVVGYSLAFGPDNWGFVGGLDWAFLRNVGLVPSGDYATTVPHQLFMVYQLMFAIITPALITGAIADRMKFKTFIVFILLWCTLVYDPICHWVWGVGGWMGKLGVLDFAGGTVVHISSGIAALAAALVVGKRRGWGTTAMPPHNMTLTVLGAGLLWFGWFGFNAGSALAADGIAVNAFVVTNTAAAAATISWVFAEWFHRGKPTILGAVSGAVAGLVAITPAAGFVNTTGALIIGLSVGVVCYIAIMLKNRLGYDDSLDAFGIHGVGGTFGALATGFFATTLVNEGAANGLFYGNAAQLWPQLLSVIVTMAYSFVITYVLLKVLDKLMGLRVTEEEEEEGLDISQHGEEGYILE